jgi:hypothetical protein
MPPAYASPLTTTVIGDRSGWVDLDIVRAKCQVDDTNNEVVPARRKPSGTWPRPYGGLDMHNVNDRADSDEGGVRRRILGEWLTEQIEVHDLDVDGFALKVGVPEERVEAWPAGAAAMTLDEALAIDGAFDLPVGTTGGAGGYFGFQAFPDLDGYDVIDVKEFDRGGDAVEALEAAMTLGLGIRVRNQMAPTDVGDSWFEASEQWIIEILDGTPLTHDPLDDMPLGAEGE